MTSVIDIFGVIVDRMLDIDGRKESSLDGNATIKKNRELYRRLKNPGDEVRNDVLNRMVEKPKLPLLDERDQLQSYEDGDNGEDMGLK